MHVSILFAYLYEESVGSLGTRLTDSCEQLCGSWKQKFGLLSGQQVLFTFSPLTARILAAGPRMSIIKRVPTWHMQQCLHGGEVREPRGCFLSYVPLCFHSLGSPKLFGILLFHSFLSLPCDNIPSTPFLQPREAASSQWIQVILAYSCCPGPKQGDIWKLLFSFYDISCLSPPITVRFPSMRLS